ncbi:MAG: PEP/pyruvate-binding domain-containing protein [Melioribacteraceae bacterium]|nr:PEP/pyruvate-binding domain-containing protein [Melioribacteraceae bacterium]MCF8352998.1 PEP/pyruvate-binding domain-containing protein [Melioribacteraceae bacterium]MCF8392889.1 PEP/pyruvate-binding domain-containing protein [Melioribacteraceae bacterium]MCF8417817.1 PEP/pyruvate-binding domain-containing protein [Melioribacteraceae bacterium]
MTQKEFPQFRREFFENGDAISVIGFGGIGGKASGLASIHTVIQNEIDKLKYPQIEVKIPKLTVIATDYFDSFMKRNDLWSFIENEFEDRRIIERFQNADLPVEILGDLRVLISKIHVPLAIRSSSSLEDQKDEPFAGIYATKMISNNQGDTDTRFQKLTEAIKFVYASTFLKPARDYLKATKHQVSEEEMAVIIQEVVGRRYTDSFYPAISGVARSYNHYAFGKWKPEDGVVNLALGLGKTIVDGELSWTYSPKYPRLSPPFASPQDLLKNTQLKYWAVNMEYHINYDPSKESEYLVMKDLEQAEYDGSIDYSASTFNSDSQRIVPGIGSDGPRIINFSYLLHLNEFRFNNLINEMISICETAVENPVEIEFAIDVDKSNKKLNFGFLQVRPMMVTEQTETLSNEELKSDSNVIASERVLGNAFIDNIKDVVFVKPDVFEAKYTPIIADEIDRINKVLSQNDIPYVLIGFGRWGSTDQWLGIPVDWGQIAGAKVIVEATRPGMDVELSQGSHFFHNLISFKVCYFSVHHSSDFKIDWKWLDEQEVINESKFVKHIKVSSPMKIIVDGKSRRGVIQR